MTYECQLPLQQAATDKEPGSGQPMRKILTIDFGFDQVAGVQFTADRVILSIQKYEFLCQIRKWFKAIVYVRLPGGGIEAAKKYVREFAPLGQLEYLKYMHCCAFI